MNKKDIRILGYLTGSLFVLLMSTMWVITGDIAYLIWGGSVFICMADLAYYHVQECLKNKRK